MRKVKFKVWDKVHKEMLDWEQVKTEMVFTNMDDKNLVFLQYTGILDKNGKQIYENDIVKNRLNGKVYVVRWNGCSSAFLMQDVEKQTKSLYFANQGFGRYEVIGNVYENPELKEREVENNAQ